MSQRMDLLDLLCSWWRYAQVNRAISGDSAVICHAIASTYEKCADELVARLGRLEQDDEQDHDSKTEGLETRR